MWNRILKVAFGLMLIPFCLGFTVQLAAVVTSITYKRDAPYYFVLGGLTYLTASVDGADQQSYEVYRRGGTFDLLEHKKTKQAILRWSADWARKPWSIQTRCRGSCPASRWTNFSKTCRTWS